MDSDIPFPIYAIICFCAATAGAAILALPLRMLWAFVTAHGGMLDALKASVGSIWF